MKKNNNTSIKYTSIKLIDSGGKKIKNKITKDNILFIDKIQKGFVVIKVHYSNLNYKDFLMSKPNNGLIKRYPHTPGIDASGTIYYSFSNKFSKGEKVYVIAKPLGVEMEGSFSQFITVPDNWVKKLPKDFNLKEIMMVGTSGFTAAKAIIKSEKAIVTNNKKPVLVAGGTSNVGMIIIFLLSNLGIKIESISSKNNHKILKSFGVEKTYSVDYFKRFPDFNLLNEKYSVIFDNLGGDLISVYSKILIKKGLLISIGNILGNTTNLNILPFLLREISILGVNTECSNNKERNFFLEKFKSKKLRKNLLNRTKILNLKKVSKILSKKNLKKKFFRYIIKLI